MTTSISNSDQNLPTPPLKFWEALKVVRNYLLFNNAVDLFSDPPEVWRGEHNLRSAFDEVDYYFQLVQLIEDGRKVVE